MSRKSTTKSRPDPGWLTPAEAARYIRSSPMTIYRACATGGLKHSRINGHRKGAIRIKREWLDEWMESYATTNKF